MSDHMTPEEFRRHGRAVIDWIAGYMERVEGLPVLSRVAPGEVREKLPERPPATGEPFEALLRDVDEIVLPGITHWQSPNFFAYFPANVSGPAILGDLLASGLGVQGMLWATSPACTEVETHVLDWLVEMLGLPRRFRGAGVIQDTASSATLCALLAARERATGFLSNAKGCRGGLVALHRYAIDAHAGHRPAALQHIQDVPQRSTRWRSNHGDTKGVCGQGPFMCFLEQPLSGEIVFQQFKLGPQQSFS